MNCLVTGPPRCGKTTVIERTVDRLRAAGVGVGGLVSPERREDGERVAFNLRDITTGATVTLAAVDRESGPQVGKYRVDVDAVDRMATDVLCHARKTADVVIIDEIAPMQTASEQFVVETRRTLDNATPILAAVQQGEADEFVAEVKRREDTDLVTVTEENRGELPEELTAQLRAVME